MKPISAFLIPILALCLAACTSSGTGPGPVKSCAERNADLYAEVTEFADAHPSQDTRISLLRPYPPVIDLLNMDGPGQSEGLLWIPPVGFNPVTGEVVTFTPMDTASHGVETSMPMSKPAATSLVQIVSIVGYVAKVQIFDSANRLVRESTQNFGYHGEMMNQNRIVPKGVVSYLVWNNRDRNGVLVADGAYLWRIGFTFKDGTEYEATAMSGFFNTACPVE